MLKQTFTKHTKLCLAVSALIILAAIVMNIFGVGLNLGIDFTGGSLLEYSVGEDFSTEEVVDILNANGYKDSVVSKAASGDDGTGAMTNLQIRLKLADTTDDMIKTVSDEIGKAKVGGGAHTELSANYITENELDKSLVGGHQFMLTDVADTDALVESVKAALSDKNIPFDSVQALTVADDENQIRFVVTMGDSSSAVREVLESEMTAKYPNFTYRSIEHAGAVSSADLVRNALLALGVALALMLVYIALRFDLYSGLAAMFGLLHDVLIMIAFMGFFRAFYQVNSSFIAAVLTIVGYSINNTIIIFDRVRENKKALGATVSNTEIVEMSVSRSFTRTVNTTITTLFTLVTLYVLGVDSIREFTFPLVIGMLAGAYSALFLNGPVWAFLLGKAEERKKKKAEAVKFQKNH